MTIMMIENHNRIMTAEEEVEEGKMIQHLFEELKQEAEHSVEASVEVEVKIIELKIKGKNNLSMKIRNKRLKPSEVSKGSSRRHLKSTQTEIEVEVEKETI